MTKKRKIICIFIIAMLLLGSINISKANVTSTDVTVNSGGTVSITLTSSVVVHSFRIELVDSDGLTFVSATKNSAAFPSGESNGSLINGGTTGEGGTTLATYVFKAPDVTKTTTYKVKFNITGMDTQDDVMRNTATVTVKPVETPEPENNTNENTTTSPEVNEENKNTTEEPQTPVENNNETTPQDPPVQNEEPEPKSQNNHLSSLTVSDGVINLSLKQTRTGSVGFNRDVEDYTIEFSENYDFDNLEVLKVDASKEDSKSSITGVGSYTINEGDNTLEVKCTAEDGKVKTYRIRVTKPIVINKSELKLNSLTLSTLNEDGEKIPVILDSLFNAETYEYECNIDETVDSVFIKLEVPKVKDKDILVKINGKDIIRDSEGNLTEEEIKLNDGKNTIRITLISPIDENIKTDYVVTIEKEAEILASSNTVNGSLISNEKRPIVILGIIVGIIVLLAIALVVLIIINRIKNNEDEKGHSEIEDLEKIDNSEEDEYLNDEKLEKLNKKYSESIEKNKKFLSEINEKEILENEEKLEETDENDKMENDDLDSEDKKLEENLEKYENVSEKIRREKLEALEKEIKEKRNISEEENDESSKSYEINKEDYLKDIRNKKEKNN